MELELDSGDFGRADFGCGEVVVCGAWWGDGGARGGGGASMIVSENCRGSKEEAVVEARGTGEYAVEKRVVLVVITSAFAWGGTRRTF